MTTTNHTPGAWSVWRFGDEDVRNVAVGPQAGGLAVAEVVMCNAHGIHTAATEAQGQANAALIAAAPDLLAALDALHLAVTMRPTGQGGLSTRERIALDTARAVLHKATGAAQ